MTGRVTGIPDARAAEGDGIEYIPTGETEDLEAAGIGGGSEHQRVLAIDGEWAYAIDSWPGIEDHLVVGGIHHVGVVVVTAGVARQVDLGTSSETIVLWPLVPVVIEPMGWPSLASRIVWVPSEASAPCGM